MYKPSYMEIASGFSRGQRNSDISGVSDANFGDANWFGDYVSVVDFCGQNFKVASFSLPAGKVRCLGVVLPMDVTERQAYSVALVGYGGNLAINLVPFCGEGNAGVNSAAFLGNVLPTEYRFTGNNGFSLSTRCVIRPDVMAHSGWGETGLVVGVGVYNPTAAAIVSGDFRLSFTVNRFARPDYGLRMVQ